MLAPRTPPDELGRLRALRELGVLDTPPEAVYDDLTQLAAHICGAPISLITLVDEERQWFKSRIGLADQATSREVSFCAHAIVGDGMMEVEDALEDDRFHDNPFVTGDPNVRFYAGAPLTTSDGYSVGTLCVIDRVPRTLTEDQKVALAALSRAVMAQLELDRQNRTLRELDQVREEFMGLVAHELRTPLSSIVGYVDELRDGGVGALNEEQARFLEVVARNAERLRLLVDDLLFMARAEAGHAALDRADVDLAQLAAEALEAAMCGAGEKKLELTLRSDRAVHVAGDRRRLAQAIDNLLSNAIKFTPAGGRIEVAVEVRGGEAAVAVSDTGMGIAADELPHVFGRFYRTSGAEAASIPGTGLGLGITRAIAEAHGGLLEVESKLGAGTTFTIRIPLEAE